MPEIAIRPATAAPTHRPQAYACSHDRRASRPRRVLRRRRGARGPEPAPGPARRRRRPGGARGRRHRQLRRAGLRHPLGDVGGGGPPPLPARRLRAAAPRPLPRLLAGGLVAGPRDGADRRAGRDRRGLPRPRRDRTVVRRRKSARRSRSGGDPCAHPALVLARRRHLEGGGEGRLRPAQAAWFDCRAARGAKPPSSLRSPHASCPASARAPRSAWPPRASARSACSPRSTTPSSGGSSPARWAGSSATARGESIPAGSR